MLPERLLPIPSIPAEIMTAGQIVRLVESEMGLLRSLVRHYRLFDDVMKEVFPERDTDLIRETDSAIVSALASMQQNVDAMKRFGEEEAPR